ncbi:MAG: hypothetical protein HKN91_02690 [Acidimicrobiia bacterium]|nr:hypothetical protein [Acidimicrobiia bacterium]
MNQTMRAIRPQWGRSIQLLLAMSLFIAALGIVAPHSANANICPNTNPTTPALNQGWISATESRVCNANATSDFYVQIKRLITFAPDAQVAIIWDNGTKSTWSASPYGCDAKNSSREYKSNLYFVHHSESRTSPVVTLTCTK